MGAPFDGSAQLRPDSRAQNSAAWRDRERAAEMTLTLEHCRLQLLFQGPFFSIMHCGRGRIFQRRMASR